MGALQQSARKTVAQGKLAALVDKHGHAKVAEVNGIKVRALYYLLAGALPSLRTAYELSDNGIEIKDWFTRDDET